jgi:hypothetical protein
VRSKYKSLAGFRGARSRKGKEEGRRGYLVDGWMDARRSLGEGRAAHLIRRALRRRDETRRERRAARLLPLAVVPFLFPFFLIHWSRSWIGGEERNDVRASFRAGLSFQRTFRGANRMGFYMEAP